MSSARPTALLAAVAAAVVLLSGCTGGSAAQDTDTLTLAPSPTPTDLGPTVGFLDDAEEPQPLATTPARDDSSYSGATFTILQVRTDDRSTLLVWSATHPRTLAAGSDFDVTAWRSFPVLTTERKTYPVLTYRAPTGQTQCVCVDMRALRAEANPQGALYPPLPKGTTAVTLTSPWFEPVTVRVTRS